MAQAEAIRCFGLTSRYSVSHVRQDVLMGRTLPTFVKLLLMPGGMIGLPLLGFLMSGKALDPLFEFPPSTVTIIHAPFSWTVFGLFSLIELGLFAGLRFLLFGGSPSHATPSSAPPRIRFPWWGWVSLTSLVLFWILAWTRFTGFADFQGLTFTPLWISFIVVLNALTYRRTGHCFVVDHPRFFIALFLWSAVFWWYFEYLNRFVQNWRYVGLGPMSAAYYAVHSTIAFSTVLPAIFSACDFLRTFPFLTNRAWRRPWKSSRPTRLSWTLLFFSSVCLIGLGIWPDYFFPFLWVAPLLFMLAIQMRWGKSMLVLALTKGQWQIVTIPACAALLCGFFWEMWNFHSAAKWVYAIPFVDRFHIFEMPLLGYAGYVPFGLECVLAVEVFANGRHRFAFMGWADDRG